MKKFLKICTWSLAFLVTFIVLFYAEENWRGARAWNKTLAELKAKGYPTCIADLIPPPIPDEDNIAAAPIFAELFDANGKDNPKARLLKTKRIALPTGNNELPVFQGKYSDLYQLIDKSSEPLTSKEVAQKLLTQLDQQWTLILTEVDEALKRPQCRWPLAYEKGALTPIPNIDAILNLARTLQLRALCQLELGNSKAAADDILRMYKLARIEETPSMLITVLVSFSIQKMAVSAIWEGSVKNQWHAADLERLQSAIPINRNFVLLKNGFRAEQASIISFSEQFYRDKKVFRAISESPDKEANFYWLIYLRLRPQGWNDLEKIKYAGWMENFTDVDEFIGEEKCRLIEQEFVRQKANVSYKILYPLLGMAMVGPSAIYKNVCRAEVANSQAILACALTRYKIHNKKLPLTLNELVPEYLDKIPNQVVISEPMIYKRVSDQDYILYSIGWNMKDDGGVISDDQRADKLDWVWASKPELYKRMKY